MIEKTLPEKIKLTTPVIYTDPVTRKKRHAMVIGRDPRPSVDLYDLNIAPNDRADPAKVEIVRDVERQQLKVDGTPLPEDKILTCETIDIRRRNEAREMAASQAEMFPPVNDIDAINQHLAKRSAAQQH